MQDIIGKIRMNFYRNQAYSVGASPRFFYHKNGERCLQVDEMIACSPTKSVLDKKVSSALYYNTYFDFYDFSLVMGKFTGVYNLWCFQLLSSNVKKQLVTMNLNPLLVNNFINEYFESFVIYFKKVYQITREKVQKDISMMFQIVDDDEIYKSVVCRDVGKVLVVVSLLFNNKDYFFDDYSISMDIANGLLLKKFNELCGFKELNKVIKK